MFLELVLYIYGYIYTYNYNMHPKYNISKYWLVVHKSCRLFSYHNTTIFVQVNNCERRELPSQSYGRPKNRNKILNIGRRTILYRTFSYSFSILNWFQTWTGPARDGQDASLTFWSRFSETYFSVPVGDTSFCS